MSTIQTFAPGDKVVITAPLDPHEGKVAVVTEVTAGPKYTLLLRVPTTRRRLFAYDVTEVEPAA